jgi:hypothetical protein
MRENATLAVIGGLVLAFAIPRVRDWILTGVLGYAFGKITAGARAAERRTTEQGARRERLRSALGVLTEGLTDSLSGYESHIKIQQSITELRTEGPPDIGPDLDKITPALEGKEELRNHEIRGLVDPIIAKLRDELRGN